MHFFFSLGRRRWRLRFFQGPDSLAAVLVWLLFVATPVTAWPLYGQRDRRGRGGAKQCHPQHRDRAARAGGRRCGRSPGRDFLYRPGPALSDRAITIAYDNITIQGAGAGRTVLKTNGTWNAAITRRGHGIIVEGRNDPAQPRRNIVLRDFEPDGQSGSGPANTIGPPTRSQAWVGTSRTRASPRPGMPSAAACVTTSFWKTSTCTATAARYATAAATAWANSPCVT